MYVFYASNSLSKYLQGPFSLNWKGKALVKKFTKAFLCCSSKFNNNSYYYYCCCWFVLFCCVVVVVIYWAHKKL